MASSKTFLILIGLLFAIVLVMSSEVSARELAETTSETEVTVDGKGYYGKGGNKGYGGKGKYGGGYKGYGGKGKKGGKGRHYPPADNEAETQN